MDSKLLNTSELSKAIEEVLRTKSEEWTGGISVDNLPGEFTLLAVETWAQLLLEKGTEILKYAKGLSIMKGHSAVTVGDVKQAFSVMDVGLENFLYNLTSNE